MIVFLPIELAPTGGTSTFARKFQAGMGQHGHQVVFSYTPNYDVILASPLAPLRYLIDAKLRRKPIIHRLDGVYHPGTSAGTAWRLHNTPLRVIRNWFADSIIYQSKFSEYSCDAYLGSIATPSVIIYNGVDTNQFTPRGHKADVRDTSGQQIFITASRFRRKDQIVPILEAFSAYRQTYTNNSKLIVIGSFEGKITHLPEEHRNTPGVVFKGVIANEKLPEYLRAADVFLFTHHQPPCPNNIIEAMACGLPICGIADGAMPELVKDNFDGELLPVGRENPISTTKIDVTQFAQQMQSTMLRRKTYAHNTAQTAQVKFDIKNMVEKYIQVIDTATQTASTT